MKTKLFSLAPASLLLGALLLGVWQVPAARSSLGPRAQLVFMRRLVDGSGPQDPHTKAVGDLNGDGYPDILVAGSAGGPLVWYEYPGWTEHVIAPQGGWSTDAEVGDVDRDGDQDVLISDWYQHDRIEWYENPGPSGDPEKDPWELHVVGSPRAHDIEIGDLDKDGDLDIVARQQGGQGGRIEIWVQESPDAWTHRGFNSPSGEGLRLGDLDRDGRPDVILSGRWFNNPGGLLNSTWMEYIYTGAYTHSEAIPWTADMNKDGRLDIILTPSEPQGDTYRTSWFEAPADPKRADWTEHVIDPDIEAVTHSLGVADLDLDGDLDVMTAEMHQSSGPDELRVYRNNGSGLSWTKQVVAETGSHNAVIADIGLDGDFDIIGANWSGSYQPVELWENLAKNPIGTCCRHFLPFVRGR